MGDEAKPSKVKRGLRAVGAAIAVPLRIADFVLGVPNSSGSTQTVRELERLAAMRRDGQLTPEEYRAAKENVLGGSA